jgi:hypothetical protein
MAGVISSKELLKNKGQILSGEVIIAAWIMQNGYGFVRGKRR